MYMLRVELVAFLNKIKRQRIVPYQRYRYYPPVVVYSRYISYIGSSILVYSLNNLKVFRVIGLVKELAIYSLVGI